MRYRCFQHAVIMAHFDMTTCENTHNITHLANVCIIRNFFHLGFLPHILLWLYYTASLTETMDGNCSMVPDFSLGFHLLHNSADSLVPEKQKLYKLVSPSTPSLPQCVPVIVSQNPWASRGSITLCTETGVGHFPGKSVLDCVF